jgi:hypothetical protein
MGPSGKCILASHQTFQWLRSSAERRRHVQAMPPARPGSDLAAVGVAHDRLHPLPLGQVVHHVAEFARLAPLHQRRLIARFEDVF